MNNQKSEKIYEQPPFPSLTIYTDTLEGVDFFASWKDFRANDEICDGNISVSVDVSQSPDRKPSAVQTNAYKFLKENEAQITQAILAGLLIDYPQIREVYGGIEDEYLPNIETAEDFRRVIRPIRIHINEEEENESAYIGFEFDCLWDVEHGLGVMTRRLEYIGCNDAEAAWNLSLAQS